MAQMRERLSAHSRKGGQVYVQDEASSWFGDAGSVAAAGLANGVYPINAMAHEIVRRVSPSVCGLPFTAYLERAVMTGPSLPAASRCLALRERWL